MALANANAVFPRARPPHGQSPAESTSHGTLLAAVVKLIDIHLELDVDNIIVAFKINILR